jgi:tRNA(His) guanylyltransferase
MFLYMFNICCTQFIQAMLLPVFLLRLVALNFKPSQALQMMSLKPESRSRGPLADLMKRQERLECGRTADQLKPLMVRLDGRAFHTFTKGLARPYDQRLSHLMLDTTIYLVMETQAKLGYTQSDEISLFFSPGSNNNTNSNYLFSGNYQKITSVLASMASAYFVRELSHRIPEKSSELAVFDCRAWNVENSREVYLNFLFRQQDAIENSVLMKAHSLIPHNKLQGRSSVEKRAMLRNIGMPWENEPQFFKSGTFVGRMDRSFELPPEKLERIPLQYRPLDGRIRRTVVADLGLGLLQHEDAERVASLFECSYADLSPL